MFYELKNISGVVIDQHKDHDIEKLYFNDDSLIGDDDRPAFSFRGEYDKLESFFDFSIDIKDAISLRNALNSFIEIQNIK